MSNTLRWYTSIDNRIRLLSIPDAGASQAKNLGLQKACGDYLFVLHGNEILEAHAIQTLYNLLKQTDADIAMEFIRTGTTMDTSPTDAQHSEIKQASLFLSSSEAAQVILQKACFSGQLHNILIRASIIQGILFDEDIHYYEDHLFLLKALRKEPVIAYTNTTTDHQSAAKTLQPVHPTPQSASALTASRRIGTLVNITFPALQADAFCLELQTALKILQAIANSPASLRLEPWAKSIRKRACTLIRNNPIPHSLSRMQRVLCSTIQIGYPVFFTLQRFLLRHIIK